MAKTTIKPYMEQLHSDFVSIQQLSSPLLACQGMLVLDAMEESRFLIKACPRPIISYTEPVEVHFGGGFTGIASGYPKTSYQGSLQVIETEAGHAQMLAETVAGLGGLTDGWYYDGRIDNFSRAYRLHNIALTFEPFDVDSESKSQIITISGQMQYNYFGINVDAKSGNLSEQAGQNPQAKEINKGMLEKVNRTLNYANSAVALTGQAIGLASSIGSLFGRA